MIKKYPHFLVKQQGDKYTAEVNESIKKTGTKPFYQRRSDTQSWGDFYLSEWQSKCFEVDVSEENINKISDHYLKIVNVKDPLRILATDLLGNGLDCSSLLGIENNKVVFVGDKERGIVITDLSKSDKINILSNMPEILNAVKLLAACFIDNDLKNHITLDYELRGESYQLSFIKINNPQQLNPKI